MCGKYSNRIPGFILNCWAIFVYCGYIFLGIFTAMLIKFSDDMNQKMYREAKIIIISLFISLIINHCMVYSITNLYKRFCKLEKKVCRYPIRC